MHVLLPMLFMFGVVVNGVLGSQVEIIRKKTEQESLTPVAFDNAKEALLEYAFAGGQFAP